MECSAIKRARTAIGSTSSGGRSVVMALGSSTGSMTLHPCTCASAVRVAAPTSRSLACIVLRTSRQLLAERDRKTHVQPDIRFRVAQAQRGGVGEQPGPGGEHADPPWARRPLTRRRVQRVGPDAGAIQMREALRGVDDQRDAVPPARLRDVVGRLHDPAVAAQHREVHQRRRIRGQRGVAASTSSRPEPSAGSRGSRSRAAPGSSDWGRTRRAGTPPCVRPSSPRAGCRAHGGTPVV